MPFLIRHSMGRTAALIAGLTRDFPFLFIRLFHPPHIISINSNGFSQIFPIRIKAIDQVLFPLSTPLLQLFLSMYSNIQAIILFIIHKFFSIIPVREPLIDV